MKKIIFLLAVVLLPLFTSAQNFYNFSKSSETYQDLENASRINSSVFWYSQIVGPINLPFPIKIFGNEHSFLAFNQTFIFANNEYTAKVFFDLFSTRVIDRNFFLTGEPLTTLSYNTEGEPGNRIFKLELKNCGVYTERNPQDSSVASTLFFNYQIWFYESDNSFEFHYGPHNITDLNVLNPRAIFVPYFYADVSSKIGVVTGDVDEPSYNEQFNLDSLVEFLDSIVQPNTVYRFSLSSLSTKKNTRESFLFYPNPTVDLLNLEFITDINSSYSVFDLLGREVLFGKIENKKSETISVENLQTGTYILKIGNESKKFIKK